VPPLVPPGTVRSVKFFGEVLVESSCGKFCRLIRPAMVFRPDRRWGSALQPWSSSQSYRLPAAQKINGIVNL